MYSFWFAFGAAPSGVRGGFESSLFWSAFGFRVFSFMVRVLVLRLLARAEVSCLLLSVRVLYWVFF